VSKAIPTYSPDATTENADWIKQGWDFPPYLSVEFFEAIGGIENLDKFRKSPAYQGAVNSGLIHDDEWVADWAEPARILENDPKPGARRSVHVHVHRRPTR
jgi:hypothetical protein